MNRTRPLLVSGDPELIDDVLRLAAANGVEVHLATDAEAARSHWALAPMVLVGILAGKQVVKRIPQRLFDTLILAFTATAATRLMGLW